MLILLLLLGSSERAVGNYTTCSCQLLEVNTVVAFDFMGTRTETTYAIAWQLDTDANWRVADMMQLERKPFAAPRRWMIMSAFGRKYRCYFIVCHFTETDVCSAYADEEWFQYPGYGGVFPMRGWGLK